LAAFSHAPVSGEIQTAVDAPEATVSVTACAAVSSAN
jgi:hypothetical protein